MKRFVITALVAVAVIGALVGLAPQARASGVSQSYIVLARGSKIPSGLTTAIAAAGGTVTRTVPQIGMVVASSDNPDFASQVAGAKGVQSVSLNATLQWVDPVYQEAVVEFGNPPASGDDDFFFDLQWGHDAVDAPEAWAEGLRGAGVRVAVLDTGFDLDHPDLAPNINFALSKDFTGEGLGYSLPDPFSHGSHTAGTVAAADNGFGTIGVAPEAELMLVKVLGDAGSGSFADVITGIVYAADNGADVISMSLGARLEKSGFPVPGGFVTAREVAELKNAIGRATTYAYQQGAVVIASAGNDGEDYDHNADAIHLPSDAPHVLSISATGPQGWAIDPSTDLDLPAVIGVTSEDIYTNHGQSVITFAAPGGTALFSLPGTCTVAGLTRPCWVFDLVFSTGSSLVPGVARYYWSAGTSMAAPHAAGVAALIIGGNGGEMHPAQVEAAMRSLADDLGKPGQDDFYGRGRVDATNAGE